jgi:methionyl-tRNA formyltransferase
VSLRLVFMGTPDFAVPVLAALKEAGHDITAVYTRAPKPAGRGMAETRTPGLTAADQFGLKVRTPASVMERGAVE